MTASHSHSPSKTDAITLQRLKKNLDAQHSGSTKLIFKAKHMEKTIGELLPTHSWLLANSSQPVTRVH